MASRMTYTIPEDHQTLVPVGDVGQRSSSVQHPLHHDRLVLVHHQLPFQQALYPPIRRC